MRTVNLLNRTYKVHDQLAGYNVSIANDKAISFFGTNPTTGNMFFQFKNGSTYMYEGIPQSIRKGLFNAKSMIGFYASNIRDKFRAGKLEGVGVS